MGYVAAKNVYEFVGGSPVCVSDALGLIYKRTSYFKKYDSAEWREAEGGHHAAVAREKKQGDTYCCTKLEVFYTFVWRPYELWQRVEWSYSGSGWQVTGGVIAAAGAGTSAVGAGMTATGIGAPAGVTVSAVGGGIAVGGGAISLIGFVIEGIDRIVNDLPPTVEMKLGDRWEWQNLKWNWTDPDSSDLFKCTGDELLGMSNGGTRKKLPGKEWPETVNSSGAARGTAPPPAR